MHEENILVFRLINKASDGRYQLMAIPQSKIISLSTVHGSQNCYCVVNGIETIESFNDVIKLLGHRIDIGD